MLYRAARWWYSPILCGALGSAVSMTARKLGNPVSPSLAAALLVTAICAAISLILILGVTRVFKRRKDRRVAALKAERDAARRVMDEVNGRYPRRQTHPDGPTFAEAGAALSAVTQNIADASSQQRTATAKTLLEDANALRQSNTPLRRPTPTPAEVRRRAESLSKRTPPLPRSRGSYTAPRSSSGYMPGIMYTPDVDSSNARRNDAMSDAVAGAVLAATAMDAIVSTPSYDPSPSYSSPSYDSGSSSSYDGGGSFGGGDSGSF
ncbi:hypothetical protein LAROYE_39 [Arthrobacter phage Laroye]|uniref:Uncharacterized protein n=1 Tax=Arthrobacter phage Laroye TaxID=1772305 RepID=A0A0U4B4B4_9CAUD|nr:hypothetical protein FDH64_gp39 [Arthrobacter phage Laroye]ALY09566.1 hypothetical protein LAROYE_39 [Arthrobacter phage Laroye]